MMASRNGLIGNARGSLNSASSSGAPGPKAMSARRCSPRSRARPASSLAAEVRIAVLVPAADYPEPWGSTFDVEAAALVTAGCTVDPIPWTQAADLSAYDLFLPLAPLGYHPPYPPCIA